MPSNLRILIALPGLHRVNRGAETAFELIATQLAALGHQVTLIGSGREISGKPYRFIHAGCIRREFFNHFPNLPYLRNNYAWEELSFAPSLARHFHPADFDLTVTCGYPYTNWMLRRNPLRPSHRPPHVFVTQNGDWMVHSNKSEFRHFSCDALVCTNPEYFQRNKDKYLSALIPNGVDPDVFHPAPADRAAYHLPPGVPIALIVSALIPSKRVIEGLRAAATIPDLHVALAGDGELRRHVLAAAGQLLPGRFHHLSLPREQMPGLYRCANLFLHMSQDEPSANVYLEALATGLPIVAHDWPVTRWTFEDQAILIDTADTAAVTATIQSALIANSPSQIESRRALAKRRFSWSAIGRHYSEFFQRVARDKSAPVSTGPNDDPVPADALPHRPWPMGRRVIAYTILALLAALMIWLIDRRR